MNEGGCNQDAGAEVSRQEEKFVRDGNGRKSTDDNGKGASCCAEEQYEEQRKDMCGCVVVLFAPFASASRPVELVSTAQLGLEDARGYVGESRPRFISYRHRASDAQNIHRRAVEVARSRVVLASR